MAINDQKWQLLFDQYDIVERVDAHGHYDITADQIKKFREPRLMCKMDFLEQVPKPFKDNGLSILAISNGLYRIAPTKPFFDIDLNVIANIKPAILAMPANIETIDVDNITNESQALDAAVASGMIEQILGEPSYLTVRGRRYSAGFDLELANISSPGKTVTYPIKSVQIEVDGGYEGKTTLALIEAKMGTATNMNWRQLLYPQKHFEMLVSKTVKTFVLFYEPGAVFTFIPMTFAGNSCQLEYTLAQRFKLQKSASKTSPAVNLAIPLPGNDAPFPQADDFAKVLYGFYKIAGSPGTEADIFSSLQITPRQYSYYFNAIRWLGLAHKDGAGQPIHLTEFGEQLHAYPEAIRMEVLQKVIHKNPVVKHIQTSPGEPLPLALKEKYGLMGDSMYPRRKKTIESWLSYFEIYFSEKLI